MGPYTTARRRANAGRSIAVLVTVEPTRVDAVDIGAGCADRSM